jgi:hypothetical protein
MNNKLALISLLLAGQSLLHAEAACPGDINVSTRGVEAGLESWERSSKGGVSPGVRLAVTSEFCAAAAGVVKENVANAEKVNAVAERTVFDYLQRHSGREGQGRSMSASLRAALGVSGLSRPQLQRFSWLRITYTKKVDGLRIDKEPFPKKDSLLMPIGAFLVEGMDGASTVCAGQITVKAGVESTLGC